jgi:cation diffusion facilitator CzcD-associated flavoprotein CzcO
MTSLASPVSAPAAPRPGGVRHIRVAIVGAGFGGLGTAIRLKQAGIDDFVVLDRAAEVGGTWQVNTYPGAQCDIPSILYSFSFAPNPKWTRLYPLQPEIHQYLRDCTERFGIESHLRLRHEVLNAAWDDAQQQWVVSTDRGTWHAQVLVGAMGPFSEPAVPNLRGLDSFRGKVFHTAAWDHDYDTTGQRVAVIGTGASAVQIIPRLQPTAKSLTVFQRTPTWIMPHPDQPMSGWPRRVFERLPAVQRATRTLFDLFQESLVPGFVYRPGLLKWMDLVSRAHLRRQVRDPELRAKLTPTYRFGCKRPTFSNTYFPALAAPNTNVVTSGIREIRENGIVTADGEWHEVDAIVFGTGFRTTDNPAFDRLRGKAGRTLSEVWDGDANAYLGTTIHGFPNLFFLLGPNSVVYTSQVVTIEAQVDYLLSSLNAMHERRLASIEVRDDVQRNFVATVDRRLAGSVWNAGGCSSYYLNDAGRNHVFFPGFNRRFRARTKHVDLADYHTTAAETGRTES